MLALILESVRMIVSVSGNTILGVFLKQAAPKKIINQKATNGFGDTPGVLRPENNGRLETHQQVAVDIADHQQCFMLQPLHQTKISPKYQVMCFW